MSNALAKIHIAKKELNLHDDDYRALLKRITGQETAKGLNADQISDVLQALQLMGWKPTVVQGGKVTSWKARARPAEHPTAKKARALWISLWQLGVITNRNDEALEAFAKRQLKCDRLVWADQQQMFKLIEALKAMAERAGWSQRVEGEPNFMTPHLTRTLIVLQSEKLGIDAPEDLKQRQLTDLQNLAWDLGRRIQKGRV